MTEDERNAMDEANDLYARIVGRLLEQVIPRAELMAWRKWKLEQEAKWRSSSPSP